MTRTLFYNIVTSLAMLSQAGAAAFSNLDFELANTNNVVPQEFSQNFPYFSGFGTVGDLLPRWSLSFGSQPVSLINLNVQPPGANYIGIVSQEAAKDFTKFFPGGFSGNYGLFVDVLTTPYSLKQRGDVPLDAQRLSIDAHVEQGMKMEVRLDSVLITDGDISNFSGKKAELERRFLQVGTFGSPFIGLDRISFVVPEPGTLSLLGVGGILSLWILKRRR